MEHPIFGSIEVGKILRQKYGEAYFKGQAAPQHTEREAWDLMMQGINYWWDTGAKFVLIDGQPRNYTQCVASLELNFKRTYVHLYTPLKIRETRIYKRDGDNPEKLALSQSRLLGDIPDLYEIVSTLLVNQEDVVTLSGCNISTHQKLFEYLTTI